MRNIVMKIIFLLMVGFYCQITKAETVVLGAGSSQQHVFDNAILTIGKKFDNFTKLADSWGEASLANLSNIKYEGNCFVFITTHGSREGWVELGKDKLTPELLATILEPCKQSVVLVSACFSGVFTSDVMQKDTRIILTAAAPNKPSFGCTNDLVYTFWDGCLIKALDSKNWLEVYSKTSHCVYEQERKLEFDPSGPMIFIGKNAKPDMFLKGK